MKKYHIIVAILMTLSFNAMAEEANYETKIIFVEGKKSYLMDGDPFKKAPKPHNYRKDEVLPALLWLGWNIKCVKSESNYIVLERNQ